MHTDLDIWANNNSEVPLSDHNGRLVEVELVSRSGLSTKACFIVHNALQRAETKGAELGCRLDEVDLSGGVSSNTGFLNTETPEAFDLRKSLEAIAYVKEIKEYLDKNPEAYVSLNLQEADDKLEFYILKELEETGYTVKPTIKKTGAGSSGIQADLFSYIISKEKLEEDLSIEAKTFELSGLPVDTEEAEIINKMQAYVSPYIVEGTNKSLGFKHLVINCHTSLVAVIRGTISSKDIIKFYQIVSEAAHRSLDVDGVVITGDCNISAKYFSGLESIDKKARNRLLYSEKTNPKSQSEYLMATQAIISLADNKVVPLATAWLSSSMWKYAAKLGAGSHTSNPDVFFLFVSDLSKVISHKAKEICVIHALKDMRAREEKKAGEKKVEENKSDKPPVLFKHKSKKDKGERKAKDEEACISVSAPSLGM